MRMALRWCRCLGAWVVIILAVGTVAVAVVVPRLGGATPYTVLTGSMRPSLPPGTLVVVRPVDPADLAVGDVITYQLRSGRPEVVTHRVVATGVALDGGRRFITQGDANDVADAGEVKPVQVRGRLWYAVPWLGRPNIALKGRGHAVATHAAVVGLLGYAALMFAGAARDRRASRSGRRTPPPSRPVTGVGT